MMLFYREISLFIIICIYDYFFYKRSEYWFKICSFMHNSLNISSSKTRRFFFFIYYLFYFFKIIFDARPLVRGAAKVRPKDEKIYYSNLKHKFYMKGLVCIDETTQSCKYLTFRELYDIINKKKI